jgi:phosphinothricin acetyltransferase
MSASVQIRRATKSDVPAITGIYNEAILTTTATLDIEPRTIEERREWLESRSERYPVLVAAIDGEVVGWTSLSRWSQRAGYDDAAETALYVHSLYRGKGIGRKLKAKLIEEARRLKFHTLIVRVTADSGASIHLNEQAGFVLVGTLQEAGRKFGRLLDVHIMQKMLD